MPGTNYQTQIYEPMTRAHYAAGGWYCRVHEVREGGRIVRHEVGERLTVEEAVAQHGTIRIFFSSECQCLSD